MHKLLRILDFSKGSLKFHHQRHSFNPLKHFLRNFMEFIAKTVNGQIPLITDTKNSIIKFGRYRKLIEVCLYLLLITQN